MELLKPGVNLSSFKVSDFYSLYLLQHSADSEIAGVGIEPVSLSILRVAQNGSGLESELTEIVSFLVNGIPCPRRVLSE